MRQRLRSDRGASAVEFALVLPILVLLVAAIVDFGRAYNIQNTLSAASREGVRVMALTDSEGDAEARTAFYTDRSFANNAVVIDVAVIDEIGSPASNCTLPNSATVEVTYQFSYLFGLFDDIPLTGTGVMRCGG